MFQGDIAVPRGITTIADQSAIALPGAAMPRLSQRNNRWGNQRHHDTAIFSMSWAGANTRGQLKRTDRMSFNIENLAGLRSGNHILQVGVFIDRPVRIRPLFVLALDAPLLLILLLLFSRLLSAAFFQLVFLSSWLRPWLKFQLMACPKGWLSPTGHRLHGSAPAAEGSSTRCQINPAYAHSQNSEFGSP
jgi:hypothetical protein